MKAADFRTGPLLMAALPVSGDPLGKDSAGTLTESHGERHTQCVIANRLNSRGLA